MHKVNSKKSLNRDSRGEKSSRNLREAEKEVPPTIIHPEPDGENEEEIIDDAKRAEMERLQNDLLQMIGEIRYKQDICHIHDSMIGIISHVFYLNLSVYQVFNNKSM